MSRHDVNPSVVTDKRELAERFATAKLLVDQYTQSHCLTDWSGPMGWEEQEASSRALDFERRQLLSSGLLSEGHPMLGEYELFYWPITGLGEPIRLTFIVGGIPFKDTTPKTDEKFNDRKMELHPYAPEATGLPILTVDGKAYAQSRAILRYVGRIAKYEGSELYPIDPMEQLECDDYIELGEDLRMPILSTFRIQEQAEKEAARAALVGPDGGVTKFLK
ncbi:GST1, partial [Symbiodinium pilosum]